MVTNTQATARKTLTLPPTARNMRAVLKAGEKGVGAVVPTARGRKPAAEKAVEKTPKVHTLQKVSKTVERAWTESLLKAKGDYEDALAIEVSVALALFAQKGAAGKVSLDAKRALMAVYVEAGFNCKTHLGEDYKTVNRRINASADLYVKLGGRETVVDWIDGAAPKDQVENILSHVKTYGFKGIQGILTYVGKAGSKRPRNGLPTRMPAGNAQPTSEGDKGMAALTGGMLQANREAGEAGHRRAEDKLPAGRVFSSGPLSVGVPMDATFENVMEVVGKLTEFANNFLRVQAPAQAPATA